MNMPVPKAPADYEEPIWRHDTVDVLIVVDRDSAESPPLGSDVEVSHPIDRFVLELSRELHVLMNITNVVFTTSEIRYYEDLPTAIYAVVTNSKPYADWCRSWGGNLVEIGLEDETVILTSRGKSQRYEPDSRAGLEFAEAAIQQSPEKPLDSGPALLEALSPREVATVEPILAELWKALESESLPEAHRAQIVAMADLIKAEQMASVPGVTQRWKLVGTVRAALRYLAKDVPRDALAWWKLIELLEKIDWTTVASELPGL